MRGDGGEVAAAYVTWQAQINFGDLTPYITYVWNWCRGDKEDVAFITWARCQVTFEKTAKEKKNFKLKEIQDGAAWLPSSNRRSRRSWHSRCCCAKLLQLFLTSRLLSKAPKRIRYSPLLKKLLGSPFFIRATLQRVINYTLIRNNDWFAVNKDLASSE